uniref:Protein krueppel n=1 Tax=Anopheles christyi TaxID=43041 RepID=A0A182JXI4_9DIPT
MFSKSLNRHLPEQRNATQKAKPMAAMMELSRCSRTVSASTTDPKIIYLDRVCRTCLMEKEKENLKDLFEFCLAETIMSCTHITVAESDGLPCHICTDCCAELERSFNFQQMTKASDATMRSLIEESVVIKQDSETKYEVLNVVITDSHGNTETSAVVLPIEELRFQLVNSNDTIFDYQTKDSFRIPTTELYNTPANEINLETTVVEEYLPKVNPANVLNKPTLTSAPVKEVSEQPSATQSLRELIILRNLKQELSEFIGNRCTAISTEVEIVDENEDDELIHVDFLKDALTEEYIQIMENQLASAVQGSKEEQLEQEHLKNLIHASMNAEEPRERRKREDANECHTMHCKICDVQFSKRRLYRKHVSRKHSEKRFECQLCKRKFAEKSVLKNHMLRHTGEKSHECEACDARFYEKALLNAHMRRHSGLRPYACKLCDKRFITRSILNTHQKVHNEPRPHVCDVCEKGFKLSWQLKTHARIHTAVKPFECPYCQKRFNQNGNLAVHIRTHSGEKPFKCKICEKAYPSQGELRCHIRQHTGEDKIRKVICTVCSKAFPTNHDLLIHMRTHTKEKPYECTVCTKRFMLRVHLTVHMRSHTGEKPFACNLCEKAFPTNYQLKMHNYVHTGEKNFTCDVCNRKFSNSANRNTHRKIHERKQN